ncbi:hypothetical protein [Streptomyces sp. NPDC127119]|uniref:hypothetical protein n=1 Tax=Streptomyces sp. NPDC127119 TaxID=3345370 RepID=UPI00362F628A
MYRLDRRDAKNAQSDPGTDVDRGDRLDDRPCPVFISTDGAVTVDGEVIATAASGDAAQAVVLDRLHQRALDRAAPVQASILDQRRRLVLRIRVREDGASELLEDPLPLDASDETGVPTAAQAAAPAVPSPQDGPGAGSGTGPGSATGTRPARDVEHGPYQEYDTSVLPMVRRPTPGPRTQPVPTPTASPVPAPAPAPVTVPEELVAGVALVCETVISGELTLAKAQAAALERQAAHRFGPDHLYALEARALEAYVAHLMGEHTAATTLSLQVAALRHRQGDDRAREDIERALASWELLTTPIAAVPLGKRLLPLWNRISGADGTERYAAAERRLSTLARVTPPAFAASLENIL